CELGGENPEVRWDSSGIRTAGQGAELRELSCGSGSKAVVVGGYPSKSDLPKPDDSSNRSRCSQTRRSNNGGFRCHKAKEEVCETRICCSISGNGPEFPFALVRT